MVVAVGTKAVFGVVFAGSVAGAEPGAVFAVLFGVVFAVLFATLPGVDPDPAVADSDRTIVAGSPWPAEVGTTPDPDVVAPPGVVAVAPTPPAVSTGLPPPGIEAFVESEVTIVALTSISSTSPFDDASGIHSELSCASSL